MKRKKLVVLSAVFATAVAALLISSQTVLVSAQNGAGRGLKGDREEPPPPFYNPYPPGILPPDLPQEIDRVRREVRFIDVQAVDRGAALDAQYVVCLQPNWSRPGVRQGLPYPFCNMVQADNIVARQRERGMTADMRDGTVAGCPLHVVQFSKFRKVAEQSCFQVWLRDGGFS